MYRNKSKSAHFLETTKIPLHSTIRKWTNVFDVWQWIIGLTPQFSECTIFVELFIVYTEEIGLIPKKSLSKTK